MAARNADQAQPDEQQRDRAEQPDRAADRDDGAQSSVEDQLAAAETQRDDNYERWMRTEAELDNFRKRVQRDAQEGQKYASIGLIRELLPGLDNLGRALEAAKQTQQVDQLIQGVEMVARQFEDILAKHGVVAIEAVGAEFDPNRHEAVQQIPSPDHPPMTVLEEIERGYMLHDRVVRPTKVIVSSTPPTDNNFS